jgi:hypothetical protein
LGYYEFITVAPRFNRAINIERDAESASAVDGYVVTATAQAVIKRLSHALGYPAGHRAWTLTGPYGSGKSAFALYLANLFGPASNPGGKITKAILKSQADSLYRDIFDRRNRGALPPGGFCPILVSGASEPILQSLLRAALRALPRYFFRGRRPAALRDLERLSADCQKGRPITSSEVVEALAKVAALLQKTGRSQGLIVIIDELGKFLEFAAQHPESGDIYVLQQLAEATARLQRPALFLITILHQAFERYVADLRPSLRDEWAKVQGRFEDVAFQEPPEQVLTLIGHAINQSSNSDLNRMRSEARSLAQTAADLELAPSGITKQNFVNILVRCAPLHPLTVLALVRLYKKFGQNQRSLFAFLVSREPHGFSSFLVRGFQPGTTPFYRLSELYDYLATNLGNGLSVGESATRWAEVQSALDRCTGDPSAETEMIKAVGLLSAVGSFGELKPTRETIRFALAESARFVDNAREALVGRSVLVYRKHSQSFALWQGSDVDIDARLREAERWVSSGASLTRKLAALWTPEPIVAKRHSFQTGTLRYFAVRFCDCTEFSKALEPNDEADGILLYCLPDSRDDIYRFRELAQSSPVRERVDVLVAVPGEVDALREIVKEFDCLRWIEQNTPELQGDAVARRELRSRIAVVEERVAKEIRSLFSPSEATARQTEWFHCGIRKSIGSSRSLSYFLSQICDSVYEYTPRLRNELLNRRMLSSAAAAARRNLIDAMISRGDEERLGITGTPPEMSMYVSVLQATKIHRQDSPGYIFSAPQADPGLLEVWKAIESFFASCELQRRSVADLFTLLQKPPFGLKMGIIPVLFCAAALAHDTEVALYENGTFVPELGVELFERLLRSADRAEIRRFRVEGVRREVFQQFASLLETHDQGRREHIVSIVRPLFRFLNRLPVYTKQTRKLSERTLAVRDALFSAREPDLLLFEDLPQACGVEPFAATQAAPERVPVFFRAFKQAVSELQRAYDDLLSELMQLLFRSFSASGNVRELIRFRARAVSDHAVEPRLRAFIHHLMGEQLDDVAWMEALATFLVSKPPRSWNDVDRARYEVTLAEQMRSFRHIEALVFEVSLYAQKGRIAGEVLRIGVTDRYSRELEAVVVVDPCDRQRLAEAVIEVEACLERLAVSENPDLALAALATVSRKFLAEAVKSSGVMQDSHARELDHD